MELEKIIEVSWVKSDVKWPEIDKKSIYHHELTYFLEINKKYAKIPNFELKKS